MELIIPWASLFGGMLLGLSAILLLHFNGKIAGISGIVGRLFEPKTIDKNWRLLFVIGMIAGGVLSAKVLNAPIAEMVVPDYLIVIAGLLVGIGTKIGNGCTSGHGICGMGRLSKRSIVATMTFMGSAMITAYVMLHVL
ncbi:YeeE/YedE family protein [Vibrio sp. SCSIO 43133]|uniref:YeeE/YedE family protein n=1 Tax=Vibrio sp. SCSIO 43133 TaxID=2802577 RepID=UPI002074EEA6|nr:YeeE/YedE family protein [Vibrio sp. SCSIO 43133]USD99904.1 YeeE/YedE family protein [Vibrio sp. SCSIO 43133]